MTTLRRDALISVVRACLARFIRSSHTSETVLSSSSRRHYSASRETTPNFSAARGEYFMARIQRVRVTRRGSRAVLRKVSSDLRENNQTRSHPEMVGDMSRVTLNSDLSKIFFVRF